jgi:ankyrin repeat protein
MQINKHHEYEGKYLKYKKKYLDLQEYLLKMNGGVKCPIIGFHQHMGECWHDALSIMLLYCDGIGENAQKIFDATNGGELELEINGQKISKLDILGDEIPQDLLPINFELDNQDDKKKFIKYAIQYITNLYSRYSNDTKPMEKKLELELPLVLPHFTRQNSFFSSLFCIKNIYGIVNHNNDNEILYSSLGSKHGGHDIHTISTLNLFSYLLLNDPTIEKKYYLYSHEFNLEKIFNIYKSKKEVLSLITAIKNNIQKTDCIYISSMSHKKKRYREEIYKEYEEKLIFDKQTSELDRTSGHAQCFFTCGGEEKYYDDNGVHRYRDITKNDKDKLIIPFQWKKYLIDIIQEIIVDINTSGFQKEDIPKFYSKFSRMYFLPEYGINYDERNVRRISRFILIKKTKYSQESYNKYLITQIPIYMNFYKNKRFLKLFESTIPNIPEYFTTKSDNGSTILSNEINSSNIRKIEILLLIPGIEKSFTIKNNEGRTPLMLAIYYQYENIVKLLLNKQGIEESINIPDNEGKTPLILAIANKYENIIDLLLKKPGIEKSFTIKDYMGRTPLMLAIYYEYENIVKLLLDTPGIEISFDEKDNKGKTPLIIAEEANNTYILELLQTKLASIN